MYLCRRLLLRGNIPKRPPTTRFCRRLLSYKSNSQPGVFDDSDVRVDVEPAIDDPSSRSKVSDKPLSKPSQKIPKNSLLLHELLSQPHTPRGRPSREGHVVEDSSAAREPTNAIVGTYEYVDAYKKLRSRDVTMVSDLPAATFISVARQASNARLSDVMDHLATDLVENFGGNEADRLRIACFILTLNANRPLLSYARLHSLLLVLESSGSLSHLSDMTIVRLTKIMVTHLSDTYDLSLLLKLLDKALRLSAIRAKGAAAINYRPPAVVQISYHLVEKLIRARRNQQALDVFQLLVKRHNIPPEAVRKTNSTSNDSSFIMLSTLVRSCLHWGWRRSAVELCKVMLRAKMSPSPPVIDLTVDVLYALLEVPSPTDLAQFSYIFRELDRCAADFQLPDGLIRLFYQSAYHLDGGKSAEILYEHTQTTGVLSLHRYPSPQGRALTWLLNYMALTSRNSYLCLRLAKYVIESYEPIPPQDRARFIAITASSGHGLQARALWERYSVGKERDAIIGNATTMLRMVSLYKNIISKTQSQLEEVMEKEKKGEANEVVESDRELYENRMKDVTAFSYLLVTQYRRIKEPLSKARHFDLTSLARAYFMLGDVSAGFDAFKALLGRKEIPDLYDINVALSAMAEYSPRGAARMIQRMIQKGVQPDPITFGTVIYFATIHQDGQLVSSLINRAREADNGQLTLKSVQALIRGSIDMADTSLPLLGTNLERAWEIIQSLAASNLICSPHTGKYCISASLKAQNPVLAYKFWTLLVRKKLEWEDTTHSILRSRIAAQIRKHRRAGWLDEDREKVVLHALKPDAKL